MAHTDETNTSPAAGETVGPGEQLIQVEFSEKPAQLPDSTEIVVVDSMGTKVPADCTGVDGNSIYTNAFLATEGDYEVTWRTVAEDGHPVSGKFSFKVEGNSETEYVKPACATDTPTVQPTPKEIALPLATQNDEPETANDSLSPFIGTGIAVIFVATVAWLMFRKKNPRA